MKGRKKTTTTKKTKQKKAKEEERKEKELSFQTGYLGSLRLYLYFLRKRGEENKNEERRMR